jgi:TolA-binding protein
MTQTELLLADLERDTAVRAGDEDLILRAASAVLERAGGAEPARPAGVRYRASSRRRRQVATALVAAALISVSGLAAALFAGLVPVPFKGRLGVLPHPDPPARVSGHARAVAAVAPEPDRPVGATESPPSVVNVPDNVVVASRHAAGAVRLTAEPVPLAAELFRGANAARRGGDLGRARRLYSELIQRYPGSDEAGLAQVSLGKLLLAEGRSKEAEREFSQYLAGGQGQLVEEALVSQAQSLGRLKRAPEERAAWQRLLAAHPNSVYAAEAKERLRILSTTAKSGP